AARPGSTASAQPDTPIRYWATFWTHRPSAVATRSSSATMCPAPIASRRASHSARFAVRGGMDLNRSRSESAIFATIRMPLTLNVPAPRRNRAWSSPTEYETEEAGHDPGAVCTETLVAPAGSSYVASTSHRSYRKAANSGEDQGKTPAEDSACGANEIGRRAADA